MPTATRRRRPVPTRKRRAPTAPRTRTGRSNRRSVAKFVRQNARKRGVIFGVLTLIVAAAALTLVTVGAMSQLTAWGLGAAADGLAFGTAWLIGENKEGTTGAKRVANKAKTYAAVCGATTADGTPCKNRGKCPHHRGGAGGGTRASAGGKGKTSGGGSATNGAGATGGGATGRRKSSRRKRRTGGTPGYTPTNNTGYRMPLGSGANKPSSGGTYGPHD